MFLIKKPTKGKFNPMTQPKILRMMPQTGRSHSRKDDSRKALPPGKRISKTGKVYWETRRNRSD